MPVLENLVLNENPNEDILIDAKNNAFNEILSIEKRLDKNADFDSVVDGVNVPSRVYRIETEVTEHGGIIEKGSKVVEIAHKTGQNTTYKAESNYIYTAEALDRSVLNRDQIRKVLTAYK